MLTRERLEELRTIKHWYDPHDDPEFIALCDLAKLALSPPSDVAGLVSELRGLIEKAGLDEWELRTSREVATIVDFGDGGISLHNCFRPAERAAYIAAANPANMTKLLDCVTSLSARIRGLEAENGKLRKALKPFAEVPIDMMVEGENGFVAPDNTFTSIEVLGIGGGYQGVLVSHFRRAATLQGGGDE